MVQHISERFRQFLPVVIDLETGGLDPNKHALLEIAATPILYDTRYGFYYDDIFHEHVKPHPSTQIDQQALAINQIVVDSALRFAVEETYAIKTLVQWINAYLKKTSCSKAIIVAHNAHFDLRFLINAMTRSSNERCPLHRFSTLDTVTMSALVYGETVLAKALNKARIDFNENNAHGALYDTWKTAQLFCQIVNLFPSLPFR
jgi:ribonuclease T